MFKHFIIGRDAKMHSEDTKLTNFEKDAIRRMDSIVFDLRRRLSRECNQLASSKQRVVDESLVESAFETVLAELIQSKKPNVQRPAA